MHFEFNEPILHFYKTKKCIGYLLTHNTYYTQFVNNKNNYFRKKDALRQMS